MKNLEKVYNMIGLCQKANRLITGLNLCETYIRRKKIKLVIVASDAGYNTKKDITNICKYYNVDVVEFGTGDMLGKMTGKELRTVIGITDEGFKKELLGRINDLGDM